MPLAQQPFRTFEGDPIFWRDDLGVVHRCEAADVHPDVRLIWTLCGRDVPADAAYASPDERTSCEKCLVAVLYAEGDGSCG